MEPVILITCRPSPGMASLFLPPSTVHCQRYDARSTVLEGSRGILGMGLDFLSILFTQFLEEVLERFVYTWQR